MIKPKPSYRTLTAILIALAGTLTLPMSTSKATVQPAVFEADLKNEQRIIGTYLKELFAFDKETVQLSKRARLVSADLEPVERKSHDLKSRLSEVQNAVREIVRKLKAANEWDDLDTRIAARLTDARDKSSFQQNGLKRLLEDASNNLTSHGSEIGAPVESLRKKLASRRVSPNSEVRIVQASYEAPVPFFGTGLKCLMANLQMGLTWRLNGTESEHNRNERICACSGGTAATCSSVTI